MFFFGSKFLPYNLEVIPRIDEEKTGVFRTNSDKFGLLRKFQESEILRGELSDWRGVSSDSSAHNRFPQRHLPNSTEVFKEYFF